MRDIALSTLRYIFHRNYFLAKIFIKLVALTTFGRVNLMLVMCEWLDEYAAVFNGVLREKGVGVSYPPVFVGDSGASPVAVDLPDLSYRVFNEGRVSVISSSVLTDENVLLIERVGKYEASAFDFSSGPILMHDSSRAIVRYKEPQFLENGIFFGGNGSFNYYHWLIEILPKSEFLKDLPDEYRDFPILVSKDVDNVSSFNRSFELFLETRQVIFLEKDKLYQVHSLLYIDAPNNVPFNISAGETSKIWHTLICNGSIDYIRKMCLRDELLYSTSHSYPKKIFLKRKVVRRNYNQDEVEEYLKRLGFVSVFMEDLTFDEQIRTMYNANCIVGPTGAAWANLVFCREKTVALCWMAEELREFSAFSTLAANVGVDMRYITYRTALTSSSDLYTQDYEIDMSRLKDAI